MASSPSGVPIGDLYLGAPIGSKPTLNASAYNPTSGIDTKVGSPTYGQLINQNKPGQPVTKPAPAVITSDVAKTDLTTAKQTLDKTTLDMQIQQQNKLQADAQAKADAQAAADSAPKEDTSALAAAANSLSMKSDGELTQGLTGGDSSKSYYVGSDGNVVDANTGSQIGSIDDVRSGKITAESLGNKGATGTGGTTSAPNPLDDITAQVKQNQTDLENAHTDLQNKITGLQNGTIPLTPDQLAQLESTKQIFQQAHDALVKATQNFTAGVTQLGITTGINKYSPGEAMGRIMESVDSGVQKVQKLDSQQAVALGKLRLSFVTNDINVAQKAYDTYKSLVTEKDSELNKLATEAQKYQDSINKTTKFSVANLDKIAKSGADMSATDLSSFDDAFGATGAAKAYFDAQKQKYKDAEDIKFAQSLSKLPPGATVSRDGNTYTSTQEGKLTRVTEKAKDGTLTTVFYNADGTVHNTSVIKPQGGGGGGPAKFDAKKAQAEMEPLMNQAKGGQGFISKEDWASALDQWSKAKGSRNDFVKAFRKYANPAAGYDYEGLPPVKGKPAKPE